MNRLADRFSTHTSKYNLFRTGRRWPRPSQIRCRSPCTVLVLTRQRGLGDRVQSLQRKPQERLHDRILSRLAVVHGADQSL